MRNQGQVGNKKYYGYIFFRCVVIYCIFSEFETSVKTFRTNPVTRDKEPYLPTSTRAIRLAITGSVVFFMVTIFYHMHWKYYYWCIYYILFFIVSLLFQLVVVLGAVLGTIIYRLSLVSIIYGSKSLFLKNHAKIVTSVSAAIINLIIIMCLTRVSNSTYLFLFSSNMFDALCITYIIYSYGSEMLR